VNRQEFSIKLISLHDLSTSVSISQIFLFTKKKKLCVVEEALPNGPNSIKTIVAIKFILQNQNYQSGTGVIIKMYFDIEFSFCDPTFVVIYRHSYIGIYRPLSGKYTVLKHFVLLW
jgi:hypothetical protein